MICELDAQSDTEEEAELLMEMVKDEMIQSSAKCVEEKSK